MPNRTSGPLTLGQLRNLEGRVRAAETAKNEAFATWYAAWQTGSIDEVALGRLRATAAENYATLRRQLNQALGK